MRGYEEYNFPAFHAAAAVLREQGYEVFSPAERDLEEGFDPTKDEAQPMAYYMKFDLPAVCESDMVVVLPGWRESTGARLETHVAYACGIPVVQYPDLSPARHKSSARFHEILAGLADLHDRKQQDYGRSSDPFANVRASSEWGVPAWVGAMVRATDKLRRLQTFALNGRLANEGVEDSLRDLAVYSVIALVLFEDEEEQA